MALTELARRGTEVSGLAPERAWTTPAVPWMTRIEEHPSWHVLSKLPVTMRAGISLNRFKVRDLLGLKVGQVFESVSPDTEDVPLTVGQTQLGWSEFEVVDQRMAVRLTRLA